MTTTICFCSAKGGTGKTAIASSLATFLSSLGKRVLLVDGDAATKGATLLLARHISKDRTRPGDLYDGGTVEPIILEGLFDFVPSSSRLGLDVDQAGLANKSDHLKNSSPEYEVIIFDVQAGTEENSGTLITKADKTVIVTEFDTLSAVGVRRLQNWLERLEYSDQKVSVLVNKMLPEYANIRADYFQAWGHLAPIPFDFEVMRSYARGEIPASQPGLFMRALVRVVSELLPQFSAEVHNWLSKQVDVLKSPLRDQLEEINSRINKQNEIFFERSHAYRDGSTVFDFPIARVALTVGVFGLIASSFGIVVLLIGALDILIAWLIVVVGLGLLLTSGIYLWMFKSKVEVIQVITRETQMVDLQRSERDLQRLREQRTQLESLIETDPEDFLGPGPSTAEASEPVL